MQQTQQYDLNTDSAIYPSGNVARYRDNIAKDPDTATVDARIAPNTDPLYLIPKRLFDIVCSLLGLFLSSPILLAAAVAIKIGDSKGPYFTIRPGMGRTACLFCAGSSGPCAAKRIDLRNP